MTEFNITIDENAREVGLLMSEIGDKIVDQANVSAINKTMTKARTAVRKEAAAATGLPSKAIGKRLAIKRAKRKSPFARLFFGTYNVSVKAVGYKVKKKGISYGRPAKSEPHAFEATMKSGHKNVFKRKGRSRLPIKAITVNVVKSARRSMRRAAVQMPIDFKKIYANDFNFRVAREIDRRNLRSRG